MRISTSARFRPAQLAGPYENGMNAAALVSIPFESAFEFESVVGWRFSLEGEEEALSAAAACAGVRFDALACSQRSGQNLSGLGEK